MKRTEGEGRRGGRQDVNSSVTMKCLYIPQFTSVHCSHACVHSILGVQS